MAYGVDPAAHGLRRLCRRLLDGLLPPVCVLCGQPAAVGGLCRPCEAWLPRLRDTCPQCALPGPFAGRRCGNCLTHPPHFRTALAALPYQYPVDRLVQRFKFHRGFAAGAVLGFRLGAALAASAAPLPDVIVPVPLHRWRRASRGFNQSEWLARQAARRIGVPVDAGLLWRSRATAAQSGLDIAGRRRNLRGAFRCHPIPGWDIALVDDVLTTGTTLNECARTLLESGAAGVSVWVAARVPAPR